MVGLGLLLAAASMCGACGGASSSVGMQFTASAPKLVRAQEGGPGLLYFPATLQTFGQTGQVLLSLTTVGDEPQGNGWEGRNFVSSANGTGPWVEITTPDVNRSDLRPGQWMVRPCAPLVGTSPETQWVCMNYVLRRGPSMSNTSGVLVGTVFQANAESVAVLPKARTIPVNFGSGRAPKLFTGGSSMRMSTGGNIIRVLGGWLMTMFGNTCPRGHSGCWMNTSGDGQADYNDYELWTFFSRDALSWRPRGSISSTHPEGNDVNEHCRNPCENHMVRLKNGTLLIVFRSRGGWRPICSALSNDEGKSFSLPQLLPTPPASELVPKPPSPFPLVSGAVWGVEPKLLKLENGLLVLSTGRGGIMLWATTDPPTLWVPYNLGETNPTSSATTLLTFSLVLFPYWLILGRLVSAVHHNQHIANASYRYSDAYPIISRGKGQTTSYTGMTAVGRDGVLVSYDYCDPSLGHHQAIFTVQINVTRVAVGAASMSV